MDTASALPPAELRTSGRGLLWTGIALALLAIIFFMAQFGLKQLIVPWYLPIMTTIGTLTILWSASRRVTIVRIAAAIVIGTLAGLEWYFVAVQTKLPDYQGPAVAGQQMPAFRTTLADGSSFTEHDLQGNKRTAMVFFRGRW